MAKRLSPKALAMLTAIAKPRALNDPVGNRDSSLTISDAASWRRARRGASISGVIASPSETMSAVRRTGKSSR